MSSCGWEGNHRSGIALVMRHRLHWFIHLWARGLWKGDEPHLYSSWGMACFTLPQVKCVNFANSAIAVKNLQPYLDLYIVIVFGGVWHQMMEDCGSLSNLSKGKVLQILWHVTFKLSPLYYSYCWCRTYCYLDGEWSSSSRETTSLILWAARLMRCLETHAGPVIEMFVWHLHWLCT